MSNDRHLTIDDGTMGSLFRRVTLATLGLDSLDGVSEQSFEVIDRADSFAERLLGGVSNVMPKIDVERLGMQSSSFAERLCDGISGLNGPKNATDLGEWQYWLDAALLMLFDEDDEEAVSASSSQTATTTRLSGKTVNAAAVRNRVAALKQTGVTPAMLHALPQAAKKAVIHEMKALSSERGGLEAGKAAADASSADKATAEFVAARLGSSLLSAVKESGRPAIENVVGRVLSVNSRHAYASRIAEKASLVSSELQQASKTVAESSEITSLTQQWNDSIRKMSSMSRHDMASVREMFGALERLETLGAVSREQAEGLRQAGRSYARHILTTEISNDVSVLASRLQGMIQTQSSEVQSATVSARAMTLSMSQTESAKVESFKRTFAALNDKLSDFTSAVSARVLSEGESAATLRWNRAADRFARLQGVSDDIDRVLLRDIEESAAALGESGIVSQALVDSIRRVSSNQHSGAQILAKAGMGDVLSHFGSSRVLGNLVTRIEGSVESLVREISRTGVSGRGVESFVSDIRQMLSTGANANESNFGKVSSVIESICARLDDFAEMTAADIVSNGYDDLTSESAGAFVSMAEEKTESSSSTVSERRQAVLGQVEQIRHVQQALATAREQAQTQIKAFVAQHKVSEGHSELLAGIANAATIESLVSAHKALAPHLDNAASEALGRMVASVQKSHERLESVAKQVRVIEDAIRISNSLRDSVKAKPVTVGMGDMVINNSYFGALGETLKTYAKIRDDYGYRGISGNQFVAGMTESKLERMLSTVKPGHSTDANIASENDVQQSVSAHSEVVLGYDEIVPGSMEWVRQNSRYPSSAEIGSLNSMLGSRKAAEIHAQDFAAGRASSVEALADALVRGAAKQGGLGSISTYAITDAGERVNVSVSVSPKQSASNGFSLRNEIGSSYMPEGSSAQVAGSLAAHVSMSRPAASASVSGAEAFVPVGVGVNASEVAKAASVNHDVVSNQVDSAKQLLARFGISGVAAVASEGVDDKFRLNVGGVDFEMSAGDFVHMVAKPSMDSIASSVPSAFDAGNALFASYASILSNSGEGRSLKSLRNAYVDSLARAGALGNHSEIGFSTQNMTKLMGVSQNSKAHRSALNGVQASSDSRSGLFASGIQASVDSAEASRSASAQERTLADEIAAGKQQSFSADMSDTSFAWVSNQLVSESTYEKQRSERRTSDSSSRELLGRIDNLLDYVEGMSDRNVGVFSTDETVRVLLEALPAEGKLGNKGLPKWRHKDTRAARAAEAKELRDALAKIGATPVQGVQRFANKQYVSPNLLQDQASGATPLFSDGDTGSTTPRAGANASNSGNNQFVSSSIKDEDLQFIAEEVFHKIEESLNEEHQRRRSE